MNKNSNTNYKFTVKNKVGELIPNADGLIENIIYSNSGYKITVKINGDYTQSFRKEVLWDFGDGEKVKGGQVEHYYKKPGCYTISATLFDNERKGYLQDYTVDVVVKDLIPTMLRFDETATKKEVKCSKIEKIAKVECLISNITDAPLDVVVKRIFDKNKEEVSKGKSYFDVKDNLNFHMDKYWTTLKNIQVLYYNTNKVYQSDLRPSEVFNPSYTAIYYRLVKTKDGVLGLKFYQVLPYKDLDRQAKQIKVLDHTSTVDNEIWQVYNIENVYDANKLPQDAVYCGMRGFVDVFYKTDFMDDVSTFSIFYDTEVGDISRQLYAAGNYTNITPLGLTVGTALNEIYSQNFKVALSGNYFLNDTITDIKISDTSSSIFIDPYLEGSLYNGLDITCYLMPLFYYTDEDDVKLADNSYYIPKDVQIKVTDAYNNLNGNGKYGESSLIITPTYKDEFQLKDWLYKIPIKLNNYVDVVIKTTTTIPRLKLRPIEKTIRLCQKPLRSLKDLVIPQEKVTEVNINELLDVYMKHPMFQETPNTREFLRLYLKSFVDKVQTESNNFVDNVANVKTCYLSHLISHLQMMGEEVYEYDNSHLEGINDLKKFSRLLSMNHSDLIGHKTSLDWDVEINMDYKGKNVGRKLMPNDELTLCIPEAKENTEEYYNNFAKVTHINGEKVDGDGCNLIVRDKFAEKTEFINFRNYLNSVYQPIEESEIEIVEEYTVRLCDYIEEDWGWNLLLPDGFKTMIDKIKKYKDELELLEQEKENPSLKDYEKADILEKISIYENEVNLLYKRKGDVLQGYYNFYLLKPQRDVIRQGNFISEDYITDEIADPNEWGRQWGITHDILMKILLTNAKLLSRRDVIPDRGYHYEEFWETAIINESKNFNNFNENGDKLDIKVKNESGIYEIENDLYDVTGSMSIRGKIYSEGTNTLEVRLQNCLIDREDEFSLDVLSGKEIEIEVEGRDIRPITHDINLYGDSLEVLKEQNIKSKLQITISGTIDNPVIKVIGEIYYNPNIIKGQKDSSFIICGGGATTKKSGQKIEVKSQFVTPKGEADEEFAKCIPFVLPVNVNANISGSGEHKAEITIDYIEFPDVAVDPFAISFTNYDKLSLSFYVDKQGNIVDADGVRTDENNQIKTGKTYIKGSFNNIYDSSDYYKGKYSLYEENDDNVQKGVWIDVGIYGSTDGEGIQWTLTCGSDSDVGGQNVFDFVYDYPSTGASYNYDSNLIDYTEEENNFNITIKPDKKEVKSEIKDKNLKLTKLSEGVYRLRITGLYSAEDESGWATHKNIDQTVDISVDSFGNIYSYNNGEKQFCTVFYAFETGESYDTNLDENSCPIYTTEGVFNIEFKLSGNIINDSTLTLHAKQSSAYGIFTPLFKDIESSGQFIVEAKNPYDNSTEEFDKFIISFIDTDGNPYNKVVSSVGYHSDDQVRMKIEFILVTEGGETVKSTYIINDISYKGIFEVDTEGVSHIWRNTNYNRQSDNYYQHVFNSLNFVSPPIWATETYEIYNSSSTPESNKKIIIKDDFSIESLKLTLSKREIINSSVDIDISSSYKTTTSEKKYKAECKVTAISQCLKPTEDNTNDEVLYITYSVEPTVIYSEIINGVENMYEYEVLKTPDTFTQQYILSKDNGEYIIRATDGTSDVTSIREYSYIDGEGIGELDVDGDVNYYVNLHITPSLIPDSDGSFAISLLDSTCHLNVVERAFDKKPYIIDWKRDGNDENLEGETILNCRCVISEDEKESYATLTLGESSLSVHDISVDNDNIILTSGQNNVITLDTNMCGQGNITIQASQYENGKSCELTQNITVIFDRGEIFYVFDTPKISFKDESYKVNQHVGTWSSENAIVTGGYTISGENDAEYHGIKGEEFNGKINIISPKINGVLLDVNEVKLDEESIDYSSKQVDKWVFTTIPLTIDSSDESETLHEIAKPVKVSITMSKGDYSLTDEFDFYRNINDDDKIKETQDVFDLVVSNKTTEINSVILSTKDGEVVDVVDNTQYKEYKIKESPNNIDGSYTITPNFNISTTTGVIKDTNTCKLDIVTDFGEGITINGIKLQTSPQSFSTEYNNNGEITQTSFTITFTDSSTQYNYQAQLNVKGNVTVDDGVTYSLDNQTLRIIPKNIEIIAQQSNITNDERNEHTISTEATFESTMQFYGALAKDSFVSLGLGVSQDVKINGFAINVENDDSQIISVDKDGNITQISKVFDITDKLGVVAIRGLATIQGNILGNVVYDVSNLTIHADELITDARLIKPESLYTETIVSNFQISPVDNGGDYPSNGRIGTNPSVNITNENSILVNGITLTTNDNTFETNPQWNVTIGADGVVSTNDPVSYTFRSIGDSIVLKATFSITGDYAGDKILYADTTIGFNDGTTTIFNKVQHEDITVTPGDNLTLENVFVVLGKYVEFNLNGSATVNEIIVNLTNSSDTVNMVGYDVENTHVRYEKKVGNTVIASLDYTLQVDGELTYNETTGKFEGLKGKLVNEKIFAKFVPSVSYEFGKTTDEENLTGMFTAKPDKNHVSNSGVTFTLNNSVKYDETSLVLKTPISFYVPTNFNNSSFDGSITGIEQQFELSDENETINVKGTVSLTGNVITGMTLGVQVSSIEVNIGGEDFVSYSNDGAYSMARLKQLRNGDNLFRNQSIEAFGATMPNLTSAQNMFRGCSNLTRFASNMYELTDGSNMFNGCSNLTTFSGMMPKLAKAKNMFMGCTLNKQSVKNIINQLYNGNGISENDVEIITIGVDTNEYDNDFYEYLKENENITSASGQKWKLKINLN